MAEKKKSHKKKIIISIIVVFIILIIILANMIAYGNSTPIFAMPKWYQPIAKVIDSVFIGAETNDKPTQNENTYNPTDSTLLFYTPDYSENIYEDETFVDLINDYALEFYVDTNTALKLPEESLYEHGGDLAVFFYDYFTDIRNGNCDAYYSYFDKRSSQYKNKNHQFTPQKIYDISIKPLIILPNLDEDEYSWVTESGIEPIYVEVKYKKRKNNGTFRYDVGSETVKPRIYMLYQTGNSYKIINIINNDPIYT